MTAKSPDRKGQFDPDKARTDVARRFREGALPTGQDFRDLIGSMALDGEFSEFREEARDALQNAREMAELVDKLKLYRFEEPCYIRTRIGNFVNPTGSRPDEISNAPVVLEGDDTRTLIPAAQAPFSAEVVAGLQDPAHQTAGLFGAPNSVMLHAIVACHAKSGARIRLTRSPAVFGPLFRRPVNLASWALVVPLLALAGLLGAALLPGFSLWEILSGNSEAGEVLNIPQISLAGIIIAIFVVFTIGCNRTLRQYQQIRLHWKPDTGLVLQSRPFRGSEAGTGDGPKTVLRCHVTMLSHAD